MKTSSKTGAQAGEIQKYGYPPVHKFENFGDFGFKIYGSMTKLKTTKNNVSLKLDFVNTELCEGMEQRPTGCGKYTSKTTLAPLGLGP